MKDMIWKFDYSLALAFARVCGKFTFQYVVVVFRLDYAKLCWMCCFCLPFCFSRTISEQGSIVGWRRAIDFVVAAPNVVVVARALVELLSGTFSVRRRSVIEFGSCTFHVLSQIAFGNLN
jgi:hypothetical protein